MIKRLFRVLGDFLRSDVWFLDGMEASSHEPLKLIFSGSEIQKNYILKLAYDSSCKERYGGKKFFWSLYLLIKRNIGRYPLIIIEGHTFHRIFYEKRKDFFVPQWLKSFAKIPLVPSNKSSKNDLRKIRKHNITYRSTKDPDELQDFYHNMYLPSIEQRHQKSAIPMDYQSMLNVIGSGHGELLLIRTEQDDIAGVVIVTQEKIPRLWSAGAMAANPIYRKIGATAATYWFSAQHLSAAGHHSMDMGLSRGFLNDGVFQFKTKWADKFTAHGARGFIIKQGDLSKGEKLFFRNNPFVYLEKGFLYGAVFAENTDSLADDDIEKWRKQYYLPGLQGLHIFNFSDVDGKAEKMGAL